MTLLSALVFNVLFRVHLCLFSLTKNMAMTRYLNNLYVVYSNIETEINMMAWYFFRMTQHSTMISQSMRYMAKEITSGLTNPLTLLFSRMERWDINDHHYYHHHYYHHHYLSPSSSITIVTITIFVTIIINFPSWQLSLPYHHHCYHHQHCYHHHHHHHSYHSHHYHYRHRWKTTTLSVYTVLTHLTNYHRKIK